MAKNYLTHLDLNKNELRNAVLQPLASAPSSPVEGQTYYNTTDHTAYIYANGAWLDLGVQGGSGSTNITISQTGTNVTVNSDTGTDGTIPAADGTNAGVLTAANYTKLSGIEAGADVTDATNVAAAGALMASNNLSDVSSAATARSNLGAAPLASPTFTGTPAAPTATAGTNTTQLATTAFVKTAVDAVLGANDAMVFKGVLDASTNPNYPAANAGDTYKISVAGKVGGASGTNVEVGDMIICTADSTSAGNQATVGSSWTIIQANIDGAVTGPASSTSGHIATFNGTGGKVIQDSGKALPTGSIVGTSDTQTITGKDFSSGNTFPTFNQNTTGNAATATKLATARNINGVAFDGSANITIPTTTKYTATIGDGTSTSIVVTHGLGTKDVLVQVRQAADDAVVECDITQTSTTQTTLGFGTAPASNALKVVIIG